MKRIKAYWDRAISWAVSSLLTLLGFSSCEWIGPEDEDPQIYMYGTPTSSYQIKGKVINEAGEPLANIQVHVPRLYFGTIDIPGRILEHPRGYKEFKYTGTPNDTVMIAEDGQGSYVGIVPFKTGADGRFEILSTQFPMDTLRYHLTFTDTDSLPPHIATDSVQVTFVAKELEGGDGAWNMGSTKKEITVVLKSEAKEDE